MDKLDIAKIKVKEIMTRNVITVKPDEPVRMAVEKMVQNDVECLPVVQDEGKLVGLITFRDIVVKAVHKFNFDQNLKVKDIMVQRVVTCLPQDTILEVVKLMKNKRLRRLPVVNTQGKLVGIVTNFDLALFGWEI